MILFFLRNFNFILRKSVIKNTINKFIFIIKYIKSTNLNFNYFLFLKFFLISEVIKKKNKNFNLEKKNGYIFSEDWFSSNIPIWENTINKEFNKNSKLKYLEIGTFEGRSAIYICENFQNIKVICVDPFDEYESVESLAKKQDMKRIYDTFQSNVKDFKDRINHCKISSNEFFKKNNELFDIIYIDGSHYYIDVENDFKNSLNCLNVGGIIIFDDFLWNYYKKIEENPINGILPFLNKQKYLKIISASNQLILKKIK
tara:strand:- start:206 stop:976 length:771 start_codon:yes stop_codon:yes gene_type:complete